MPQILYSNHGEQVGPWWTITRQPFQTTNPFLVHFSKRNRTTRALDQIAKWDPVARTWCSSRWVPRQPIVPDYILIIVQEKMINGKYPA